MHGGVRWAEAGVRAQDTRFWWQLCWTRPALWASFSRGQERSRGTRPGGPTREAAWDRPVRGVCEGVRRAGFCHTTAC